MEADCLDTKIPEVLHGMVKCMVRQPEQVYVMWNRDNGVVIIDIEVAPDDLGRLIGRNGVHARAIRTILEAVSMQSGVRQELNLQRSGKDHD